LAGKFRADLCAGDGLAKSLRLRCALRFFRCQHILNVLLNGLILHLLRGLRLGKVLCDSAVLCFLRLLPHSKLSKGLLLGEFAASNGLTEALCLCGPICFRSRHRLLKILRNGAIDGILRRLSRLERSQLRLSAELTRRKALGKLLGLRLVSKLA